MRLLFILFCVTSLVYSCGQSSQRVEVVEDDNDTIRWVHLSSKNGDLPVPGPSTQQTASQVLDIDQDGVNDFVIAARQTGPALLWYRRTSEGWTQYVIDSAYLRIEAGGAHYDIDQDGDLDIVFGADAKDNKVWWWENPYPDFNPQVNWTRRLIKDDGGNKHHDEIFGDFDGDGQTELVFWNQRVQALCLAGIPEDPQNTSPWEYTQIYTWEEGPEHEGLAKADIDGDGTEDIVGGGRWFKYQDGKTFQPVVIDDSMRFTRAAAGQLVEGGVPEVVFVPGDADGPLKWYSCQGDPQQTTSWMGHEVLDTIVVHGHSIGLGDVNIDGHLDIFNAEMHTPGHEDQARMRILYGDGAGNFDVSIVSVGIGNHEARLADLDGDGDLDILDKPYTWDTPRIDIWINQLK